MSILLLCPVLIVWASGINPVLNEDMSIHDMKIWEEFVAVLRKGDLPSGKIRPYREELRSPIAEFLTIMKMQMGGRTPDCYCQGLMSNA